MTANIENKGEKTMFVSANVAAWHNLGRVVDGAMSWAQAMEMANLDWTVAKRRLVNPLNAATQIDAFGIFREDNNQYLGMVGSDYTPIQNVEQFSFLDAVMGVQGGAHYETAGALGNGERVFCLAKVENDFYIRGTDDLHKTYLLVANSHNGSMRLTATMTEVRVVCENTLTVALMGDAGKMLKVRHTKNAQRRLQQAESLIKAAGLTSASIQEKLEALAHRRMTKASLKATIERLFPTNEKKGDITTQAETKLIRVLELFEENDNNAIPQIAGTSYALLNAFTNYVDHESNTVVTKKRANRTEESIRSENALFGGGANFKNFVLDTLLETTKSNPKHDFTKVMSLPSIIDPRFKREEPAAPVVDETPIDEMFPETINVD